MAILVKQRFKNTKSHKKPTLSIQASFLIKLSSLVQEGFTLGEALVFLAKIMPKEVVWIQMIIHQLENGERFDEVIRNQGFSERVCSQVYLSLIHGRFSFVLYSSGQYLADKEKQKKELIKLLHYPIILLVFMSGIMIAMRLVLLPSFEEIYNTTDRSLSWINRFAVIFIQQFPTVLFISLLFFLLLFIIFQQRLKTGTAIKKATFFMGIPLLNTMLRLYYTHFFSYEWSQLLRSGYQMNAIIELMQSKEATKLMREVAEYMELKLVAGQNFQESMQALTFFNQELGLIILHGEATSQLASELALYSQDCQDRMLIQLQRMFSWIQPFIFLIVAFLILCIYLALLLPTFSMMEGMM
ncbi:competence type IV pilus assembly protein ComGB [Carnobacterium funditum]|uniref:competence type IV pilus assembly protein ComGB n=1 Tax=Carnobacterium funditum TaxID=2752 RepID=UPI0005540CEB|nr:competence type IV pilus assembly protein ComGB [Carnobacterium funditum]